MDWTQTITIIASVATIVGAFVYILHRDISEVKRDVRHIHQALDQNITEAKKDVRLILDKISPPINSKE